MLGNTKYYPIFAAEKVIKTEYDKRKCFRIVIYTGGTIGMIENVETGALENFDFEQLQRHIPELQKFSFAIDSYQFNPPIAPRIWNPKHGRDW